MKQVLKCQFSALMHQSIILIQICPKSPLYTKWVKIKHILETTPFNYSKRKFGNEIGHLVSLAKLTQNLLQFQNKHI